MTGRDYFNLVNVFLFFSYIYCIVVVAVDIVIDIIVDIIDGGGGRLIECAALSDVIIKMYATV